MPILSFRNLATVVTLSTLLSASWYSSASAALEPIKTLNEEQSEVNDLLGKVDSVELRKISPRVFRLADRLLIVKREAEAQRYFEKGLEGNPWALEHQLTLGEILNRAGQSEALRVGLKQLVLGITPCDLFGGTSNYLFGAASTGKFLGVVSLHRFRAAFNDEAPKRERFTERLLKQSLSTIGFMLGVPRCNTPECARAYPQSIAEHDQKPATLCPTCRAGFEAALGQKLPVN